MKNHDAHVHSIHILSILLNLGHRFTFSLIQFQDDMHATSSFEHDEANALRQEKEQVYYWKESCNHWLHNWNYNSPSLRIMLPLVFKLKIYRLINYIHFFTAEF